MDGSHVAGNGNSIWQLDRCEKWEHVYRLYSERRWEDLDRVVREFVKEFPTDSVAAVYAVRATEYLQSPPSDGWNGVKEYAVK